MRTQDNSLIKQTKTNTTTNPTIHRYTAIYRGCPRHQLPDWWWCYGLVLRTCLTFRAGIVSTPSIIQQAAARLLQVYCTAVLRVSSRLFFKFLLLMLYAVQPQQVAPYCRRTRLFTSYVERTKRVLPPSPTAPARSWIAHAYHTVFALWHIGRKRRGSDTLSSRPCFIARRCAET